MDEEEKNKNTQTKIGEISSMLVGVPSTKTKSSVSVTYNFQITTNKKNHSVACPPPLTEGANEIREAKFTTLDNEIKSRRIFRHVSLN